MLQVRPAKPDDASTVMALKQAVLQQSRFLLLEVDEYQPTEAAEVRFIVDLAKADNGLYLLAMDDDIAVGHLVARGGCFRRNRHSANVFMAVHQDYWGRGIGRQLIDALLAWFADSRLTRLELTTAIDNNRAISLYQSAGFEIEGCKRGDIRIDGETVDSYLMSFLKNLPNPRTHDDEDTI